MRRMRTLSILFIVANLLVGHHTQGVAAQVTKTIAVKQATEGRIPISVAGLIPTAASNRLVENFNPGWRFHLGDAPGAERTEYNDSLWEVVSTPHCVQLEPAECSGGRNYQGIAWYRKHFTVPADYKDRDIIVYFEAAMGKQQVYINGQLALKHLGGYLPFAVHLQDYGVKAGDNCVIAVQVDNSDDKSYPPGKTQYTLDFAYHGGIYRDVWLIGKNKVAVTDAIEANQVAGGGVFVHYRDISEQGADVLVNTHIRNIGKPTAKVMVQTTLLDATGRKVATAKSNIQELPMKDTTTLFTCMHVKRPQLWSPESPTLYTLDIKVYHDKQCVDGGEMKIGIRSFEFKGKDGFWLNGRKYRQFIGANRHQDFAYVGNALPNSQQWRDAKRLKNAGFNIIRTAHYPQDPAFMDACDELGLFVIVATPGWQYWNKDPQFEQLVLRNTHEIIRRDRNHPSVLMWEPILNETRYPLEFSLKSLEITKSEYPYPYRPVAAADVNSAGVREHYDVVYGWPGDDEKADKPSQCIFTREFGEYVDDWYAHNNLNRASRSWGERPQLLQALSLAQSVSEMYRTTGQYIGGCQWHPFDHQRGYHPDPYWGGIYDAFRQPKTAFYMFHSQLPISDRDSAFVYIAHEMTQFSDSDVVVFSNCDSVRLSIYDGARSWILPVGHAPVIFRNVWNFWEARDYSYRQKAWQKVKMVAEGYKDGKIVTRTERMPARRSTRLRLYADELGRKLVADGSDFIVVVCEVTDDEGHVRRLAKENIQFTVSGEGTMIGDASINANPRVVEWGSAPVLIRSSRNAGIIHIHAEVQFPGTHAPTPADLDIESIPEDTLTEPHAISETSNTTTSLPASVTKGASTVPTTKLTEEQKKKLLKEVEQQQADFGISNKK